MLKGLDALLSPDLLRVPAEMGHGDELVLVDRNFPVASCSRRVVRLDGATLPQAAQAVVSLLPIDTFIPGPVSAMQMVETPHVFPEVQLRPQLIRMVSKPVPNARQRSVAGRSPLGNP